MRFERTGIFNYQVPDHPTAHDLDHPKIKFPEESKTPQPTDHLKPDGKHKNKRKKPKGQTELPFETDVERRWQQEHI